MVFSISYLFTFFFHSFIPTNILPFSGRDHRGPDTNHDVLKRSMHAHTKRTLQDSVGPRLIVSMWRQRGEATGEPASGTGEPRALALGDAPGQLLSSYSLPFLALLRLGTSSFMALKKKEREKVRKQTPGEDNLLSEIPHSETGRALVVV